MDAPDEEFETTIYGPWMGYWEITHTNRHTEAMIKNEGTPFVAHMKETTNSHQSIYIGVIYK